MSSDRSLNCALIYDFDGTLAEGNCAEHGLMSALGIDDKGDFWAAVKDRAIATNADEILTYLGLLAERAVANGSDALDADNLSNFGGTIPLFRGVEAWFPRINSYARENSIHLTHYIISSGIEEMIRGSKIGHYFTEVYGCRFGRVSDSAQSYWPTQAINYTTKTQFLFRINKGISNAWDNAGINRFIELADRPLPFEQMIFLGDGDTDIPSMKMVRHQGGHSLAVFDEKKWASAAHQSKVEKLIAEERANYVVPADYREGSQLDVTIKGLLQLIKRKRSS